FPRCEGVGTLAFTSTSQNCWVIGGFGVVTSNAGSGNVAWLASELTMTCGPPTDGSIGGIDLTNLISGTSKSVVVRNSGATEVFSVGADGTTFSATSAYSRNGPRWQTVDGTRADRGLYNGTGTPLGTLAAQPGSIYADVAGGG